MLPAATASSPCPLRLYWRDMERNAGSCWEVELLVVQMQVVIIYNPHDTAARDALRCAKQA
jgi:hypothetical protein